MDALRTKYTIYEELGKGSYATVYRVVENSTGKDFAAKIMDKQRLGEKGLKQVRGEVDILRQLDHPNVIKLNQAFEDDKICCIILEIIGGGELFKRITQLQHYSERTACELMRNFLRILVYLHGEGIVHRDLKPDNLLLTETADDVIKKNLEVTNIKLADFGFAARYKGTTMVQACGTPYYIAPELLQTGVFKTIPYYVPPPCDMWSAGVIAYVLLCGYPPFRVPRDAKDAKSKLFRQIVKGKVMFEKDAAWGKISSEAKDFISKLLVVNQNQRLTAAQALEHPWFASQGVKDEHLGSSIEEMKSFNSKSKIKGAVYGVEAAFRLLYSEACDKAGAKRVCLWCYVVKMRTAQLRRERGYYRKLQLQNSSLLDQFDSATEPLRELDLANTYLGPKGFEALVSIINKHSTITKLKLSNSLIDTEQCIKLCKVLQDPHRTSNITHLDLSNNPLTHPAGRALLSMMQARRKLTQVHVDQTYISSTLCRKIQEQAARNTTFRASRTPPPKPGPKGKFLPPINK